MAFSRLPLAAIAAMLALQPANAQNMAMTSLPASGPPIVTLSVTQSIESAPDMATVSTGVQTRALTAREAIAQNAAQMELLVAAVLKAGIARKDIQTSSVNLNAQYDYTPRPDGSTAPRFVGYEAGNQISVRIRDIRKVGDTIDRMVEGGATNLNGPMFGIADDAPLLVRAREQALKSAAERALFYARQSGYGSVRLVSISEAGGMAMAPQPVMAMVAQSAEAKTTIEPGQMASAVSLTVQYALEK
jgi:uncharacterized protein